MSNDIEKQVYTALENKEYYLITEYEKVQSERDNALTALHEAKEQLELLHKSKSEFVSVIRHEFRSALTTIQGFSEMIYKGNLSTAEMKEFALDIYQDAQHLSYMINDMLHLEHMEMSRLQLHCSWLDLNSIIMEVVNRIQQTTMQHTIHTKLANALPVLIGDAEKLSQVIENLLDNAIKYSPDGGDVYVSNAVEGGSVHVCVQDNGIGIPAEAINRIFERYERVETKINQIIPSTGLGLALVRQIVRMHGGQIWVESVLGEGSSFHFTVKFVNNSTNVTGQLG